MILNSDELFKLKDELNLLAEQSGKEYNTCDYILKELSSLENVNIYEIENTCSIIAVFQTNRMGKTILLRADIDAINFNGVFRHLCGHDGHTAILLYLAKVMDAEFDLMSGTVILLFQAAEETGKGAYEIINSGIMNQYKIDYLFALHNLPGFPINSIIVSDGIFAKASSGIRIEIIGEASHAAEPNKAKPLEYCISQLINKLHSLAERLSSLPDDILLTVTHINFGKPNFGTILNQALIYSVVRSSSEDAIQRYKDSLNMYINEMILDTSLKINIQFLEEFPLTKNSPISVNKLKESFDLPILELSKPFPWSEDFGHFSKIGDICLFGLGIGENSPALHTDKYSFPKECLITGLNVFYSLVKQTNFIEEL